VRLRLDHVVIQVSSWEAADAFYRDVLGAELIEREGNRHHYRFGDQQLNVHGPGVDPGPWRATPGARAAPTSASSGTVRSRTPWSI